MRTNGTFHPRGIGKTDPGIVRANNEDEFICDNELGLYAVIDGIGGQAAGERAAAIAKDLILKRMVRQTGTPAERLREAIALANNEINKQARENPDWHGMACVMTVALVGEDRVTIGHVGDTRLYLLRDGKAEKVTPDHSPIGEREDAGAISEVEAMRHPRRNEVYRDVGSEPHTPDDENFVDIIEAGLDRETAILLCSDGLSDLVSRTEIARIAGQNVESSVRLVGALIDAANNAGGKDNITVVYVVHAATEEQEFSPAGEITSPTLLANIGKDLPPGDKTEPLSSHRLSQGTEITPVGLKPESLTARTTPLFRLNRIQLIGLTGLAIAVLAIFLIWWRRQIVQPVAPESRESAILLVDPESVNAFRTIGEALHKARPGDTVEVAEGYYEEKLILPEGVSLISVVPHHAILVAATEGQSDQSAPPTDPGRAGAGFLVKAENVKRVKLTGFKLLSGGHRPVDTLLLVINSELEVNDCVFSGARSTGLLIEGESNVTLRANSIIENKREGLEVQGTSFVRLLHNQITDNGLSTGSPGLRIGTRSRVEFISGNMVFRNGGAGVIGLTREQLLEMGARRNYFRENGINGNE